MQQVWCKLKDPYQYTKAKQGKVQIDFRSMKAIAMVTRNPRMVHFQSEHLKMIYCRHFAVLKRYLIYFNVCVPP